ncbi:MAG: 23S rRNA (adenine(2030)-N(6))-methyltransferase RlmJ [Alphaproteobacteria bacterium]|nr:23S rRNA (adenine(2030)-N(6))-methyltransferase RlmJ [Alphaproteobacteria bacterium]
MNYLHAYHAGNHTEVFKHAALVKVLLRVKQKMTPIAFIDTHAGLGITDLQSPEALRTGEAQLGIMKVIGKDCPVAQPYFDIIRSYNGDGTLRRYPGSVAIARALLSSDDQIVACELQDTAHKTLKTLFKNERNIAIHHRDGYEAMQALIPPRQRRGVVFIDPPFEDKDEMNRLTKSLTNGLKKWPSGVFVGWYPIKDRFAGRALVEGLLGIGATKLLSVEFVPFPNDRQRLAGSGLVFCNTPWKLDEDMRWLCKGLHRAFGIASGRWSVSWPGE